MADKKITKKVSKDALSNKYLTNNWYYRYPAYLILVATLVVSLTLNYGFVMNIWTVFYGKKVPGVFLTRECSLKSASTHADIYSCFGTFTPNDPSLNVVDFGSGAEVSFPFFTKSGETFIANMKLSPGQNPEDISNGDIIVIEKIGFKHLNASVPSIALLTVFGFLSLLSGYTLKNIISRQIVRRRLLKENATIG